MKHSDRLHNRDLSWLGFNERVLMEAADPSLPIMERFRFLAIFSSNLDEFFRVRYPIVNVYQHLNDKELKRITPAPRSRPRRPFLFAYPFFLKAGIPAQFTQG